MKVALVCSVGGHLSELLQLRHIYGKHEHVYILNDRKLLPESMQGRTHFIVHSERDLLTVYNLWECWHLLRRERPDVIMSTGAGPAVPAFAVARLLGIRRIFIESFCAIYRPTMTGRLIHALHLADRFLYQWPYLARFYPRGEHGGLIYAVQSAAPQQREPRSALVTLGNVKKPFPRLVNWAEAGLARVGIRNIQWQLGYTRCSPSVGVVHDFLTPEAFAAALRRSAVVVCQAGEGSVMEAVQAGHRPLVVPRRAALGEHVNDHQLELAQELSKLGWIESVQSADQLAAKLAEATPRRSQYDRSHPATLHELVAREFESMAGTRTRP